MWRCIDVATALKAGKYRDLSPWKRFWLRCHVVFCFVCGKYHRDLMKSQDIEVKLRDEPESCCPHALDPEQAERLKRRLEAERRKSKE
ncbi:MAG: hypothetical protein RL095_595 [Verrucomicrobiota bacterium]|jgi:hypothetical protein